MEGVREPEEGDGRGWKGGCRGWRGNGSWRRGIMGVEG